MPLPTDVHPFDICEKLGPKYACIPEYELNKCRDFYQDLLRFVVTFTELSYDFFRVHTKCDSIVETKSYQPYCPNI